MSSSVQLKSYDVRVACEFAITDLNERREALRETIKHKMIGDMMAERKFFWQRKRTYDECRQLVEHLFDSMKAKVYGEGFVELDKELKEFELLHNAAKYVGDNVVMNIDVYDIELLGPNLRGM